MEFDYKGSKSTSYGLSDLEALITDVPSSAKWVYMGMIVEIDPTFDFSSENLLVRWTDVSEGFNDKLIVNSLEEFLAHFTLLDA